MSNLPAIKVNGVWRVLACIPSTEESKMGFPAFSDTVRGLDQSQWQEIDMSHFSPGILNQGSTNSCFPAGTPITMGDGSERPIEEIGIGNEVYTHLNRKRKVIEVFERNYTGTLYSIFLKGCGYSLRCTEEHPIAVWENDEVKWVEAKNLKNSDFVLMPFCNNENEQETTINVENLISEECLTYNGRCRTFSARKSETIKQYVTVNKDFAVLIGLFLAEGSYTKNALNEPQSLFFTFSRKEKKYHDLTIRLLKEVFGVDGEVIEYECKKSCTTIAARNTTLAKVFMNLCGQYSTKKFVNPLFFTASKQVKMGLIRGWLMGDGVQDPVKSRGGKHWVQMPGVTSSEQLHRGMFRLALSCGLKPGCSIRKKEDHQTVESRVITFYSNDVLELFPEHTDRAKETGWHAKGRKYKITPHGFACRAKNIVKINVVNMKVYNIEVEDDHSYVANFFGVHNCVGHATCSGYEMAWTQSGRQVKRFNPFFTYSFINGGQDAGAMISDALRSLQGRGICSLESMPPRVHFERQVPPAAVEDAKKHRLGQAMRCRNFEEICSALSLGFFTPLGILVDQNFSNLDGEGVAGVPRDPSRGGGHAILGVGLKVSRRYGWLIKIKNSWGNWGRGGFAYIHRGHFQFMNPDAFAIQSLEVSDNDGPPAVTN